MTPPDPVFLATATEIVLRAGDIQIARRESGFHVEKKGTIDLVTEVDFECERVCRQVIAERFPDHDILAEELSRPDEIASSRRFNLQETLANAVFERLAAFRGVRALRVRTSKPDVYPDAHGVGVEIASFRGLWPAD